MRRQHLDTFGAMYAPPDLCRVDPPELVIAAASLCMVSRPHCRRETARQGERDALCRWMSALANGDINVSDREAVLRALPADFNEAAAAAGEFTADRP
jgi:hypothetical protein